MSIKAMSLVWEDQTVTSRAELLVLLAMADHARDPDFVCYPSIHSLAKKARCSERTVYRIIAKLELLGKLSVKSSAGPKGTNLYRVTPGGVTPCHPVRTGPVVSPESSGTISIKGTLKGFKALKRGPTMEELEAKAMRFLSELFSPEEYSAYGANWRLRFRECPDKFRRVVDDLVETAKSGNRVVSYAAIANIRWNEFAPRTTR